MNIESKDWAKPYHFFEWLSSIPRKSHDEKLISDSLMEFARKRGLYAEQDEALNVLIRKSGSTGRENEPPILMQAHMDMVFETEDESLYPYGRPLQLTIAEDGDTLSAKGTTLGADDGSGMSVILALLDSTELSHPPIDGIFTMNEEDGLEGASRLSPDWICGDRMINLDGEVERSVICGCAGAFRGTLEIPVERNCAPEEGFLVEISGLHGGHSGLEIDKGYQNAILLAGRILAALKAEYPLRLVSIRGGKFMNAIPVSAEVAFVANHEDKSEIMKWLLGCQKKLAESFVDEDKGFGLSVNTKEDLYPMLESSTEQILQTLLLLPNGVQRMSSDIPGLVQTSSNLGIAETEDDLVRLVANPRSSNAMEIEWMKQRFEALASLMNGRLYVDGEYPSWEYAPVSTLRNLYMEIYRDTYGGEMEEQVLHGGLECGIIARINPKMDVISIGPEIPNVHTVREEMSLSSLGRVWTVVKKLMEQV